MLAINQLLQERYRIVRQLGHGGMGAVYEAVDERFGTPVALKEILVESANAKQKILIANAFEREAKSLAKAAHEAIPYVRDYFSELDRQFLVMELVKGEDLAKMLEKRGKPFPLDDVVNWMLQLLDALDYLHNLTPSIIHRDIKPQNLKLNFRRKIKLLDFGIAKSGDNISTITNQTFVGATLNYSPIEQILRVIDPTFREFIILKYKEEAGKVLKQNTDVRCDIYSLGATFYHLLTNQLPTDVVKRTLESWEGEPDPLPNPSELEPNIPPSISACLLKAMEIKRDNRFSSALEMQEALQTAIEEEKLRQNEVKSRQTVKEIKLQDAKKEETREQLPTQAVTEKLVPEIEIKDEIENDFMLSASSVPTEPLNPPPSETQPSSEFVTNRESDFQQSENITKAEPTGKVYSDEILPDKKKVVSEPFSITEKEIETASKNNAKMFWLLPIAALSILTVSGIGGIIWMSSLDSTNSNKPETKAVISTPSATATTSPTVAPSASPTNSPAPVISDNKKPPPTAAPKIVKPPPTQNPVKTPAVQRTPKPKKPPNLSDDCIYNGKC